jgi:hypothetical protein
MMNPFDHFSDRAIRLVADNKIQAALDAGEFDNLPGLGKPSPIIDEPYGPFWWIRRKLRAEQVHPNPADGWSI